MQQRGKQSPLANCIFGRRHLDETMTRRREAAAARSRCHVTDLHFDLQSSQGAGAAREQPVIRVHGQKAEPGNGKNASRGWGKAASSWKRTETLRNDRRVRSATDRVIRRSVVHEKLLACLQRFGGVCSNLRSAESRSSFDSVGRNPQIAT